MIVKRRWAFDSTQPGPQKPIEEILTFVIADDNEIEDKRVRQIDGQNLILVSVSNPFYSVPELPHEVVSKKQINTKTGDIEVITKKGAMVLDDSYFNSNYWNPYQLPILPNLTLIDEETYWVMESDYYKQRVLPMLQP